MSSVMEAIEERRLGYPGVAAKLDRMSEAEVYALLGSADREVRTYQETGWITRPDGSRGPHWKVGDGQPALATDDPGVVVAMNLCAIARNPWVAPRLANERHPGPCYWCEPVDDGKGGNRPRHTTTELLTAISHATYFARKVRDHLLVWVGEDGAVYARAGHEDEAYLNDRWAAFEALHPGEQRRYAAEVVSAVREGATA